MIKYKKLISLLQAEFGGKCIHQFFKEDHTLVGFSPITKTEEYTISWMRSQELDWETVRASVVIADEKLVLPANLRATIVIVENPRLVIAKLIQRLAVKRKVADVHPSTIIGNNCSIPKSTSIGCFTVVGHNVIIGEDCFIGNNVTINENTRIGDRVVIKSGAVIGEEGFGFDYENDGTPVRIPHIGSVIIGNDVEIGSQSTVCRGTIGDTEICDYAKIDDHVHISHNVLIGKRAMIIACAEISGSVCIGDDVWIAPNASITNSVNIGSKSFIGIGSAIGTNIEPGAKMFGNPARQIGTT